MTAPRITAALAHWNTTIADTGGVFWANVLPSVALSLQRVLLAAGHLHDAVEAELPELLERMAAAEVVVEAARIYHQAAPGSDVWDTYDRRVGVTLAAYDELEQGGGG